MDVSKFHGIFPAFYACYGEDGEISAERTRALAGHLLRKGVQGLYVGGSSGECIYHSVEERKKTLENVMAEVKGKLPVQQYKGLAGTGGARGTFGRGCGGGNSPHLFSSAGTCGCPVLE